MSEPNENMEFDPEGSEVVERKDITPSLSDDPRSLARRIALQVLYQVDSGHQSVDTAMRFHLLMDDSTGKIIDIDEDIAAIVVGDLKTLTPDNPLSQRIHLYNLYFEPSGRFRPGQKPETAARMTRTVNYLLSEAHAKRLAIGVSERREDLDEVLQDYAPDWPIQQVAVIDRNILRMALYELAITSDEPVSAIINEAVELANLFGAEGASRFVNGVLGTIAQQIDDVKADLNDLLNDNFDDDDFDDDDFDDEDFDDEDYEDDED